MSHSENTALVFYSVLCVHLDIGNSYIVMVLFCNTVVVLQIIDMDLNIGDMQELG